MAISTAKPASKNATANSTSTSAPSSKFLLQLELPQTSLTAGTNIPPPPPSPPPEQQKPKPKPLDAAAIKTAYNSASSPLDTSTGESPNPLRSNPTSSHSLGRKFSGSPLVDHGGSRPKTPEGIPGASAGTKRPGTTSSVATARQHSPGKMGTTTARPMSPPASKRPLSVRKLLSLRALNAALGRSSLDSPTDSGGGGYANGGSAAKKSSDNLSTLSFARPESAAAGSIAGSGTNSVRRRRSGAFWGRSRSGSSNAFGSVAEETDAERQRQKTPPPTLPEVKTLGRGFREKGGDFLNGDMFKDIK